MTTSPLILKSPKGWFAAGAEVGKALSILSDGAFKLYVYVCLNARRDTGVLEITQTDLARNLKRARKTVRDYLDELGSAGVCRSRYDRNPVVLGEIEVTEEYWPYRRTNEAIPDDDAAAFVSGIRKLLLPRACVRAAFSTADEILAREWFERGISMERIEQTILMGCSRKYVAWRNNQSHAPIGSLRYFQPILDELEREQPSLEYWDYVRLRLERMEKLWNERHSKLTKARTEDLVQDLPSRAVSNERR